ncbi:MAG TPA: hypothetical protein PLR50_11370 [Candidatus Rifleibacterium sp.]|nr:hypothetical protein [Candidatus Rifleibacterium sp.]
MRKENKTYPDQLISVPESEWPRREPGMIALWRSNRFLVQVYVENNGVVRLSVCRTEINNRGQWQENIAWEELQEIKNQCGYEHFDAVEVYPRQKDVVNVANMRHLWVFDEPLRFAWRNV